MEKDDSGFLVADLLLDVVVGTRVVKVPFDGLGAAGKVCHEELFLGGDCKVWVCRARREGRGCWVVLQLSEDRVYIPSDCSQCGGVACDLIRVRELPADLFWRLWPSSLTYNNGWSGEVDNEMR